MVLKYILLILFVCLAVFIIKRVDRICYNEKTLIQLTSFTPKFIETWHSCATENFLKNDQNAARFWKTFQDLSRECDRTAKVHHSMKVFPLKNRDETKFAILPIQKNVRNVFITLGIGLDVSAEKNFLKLMTEQNQNVTFYGADPIVEENSKLYSEIGQFFPFAVGSKAGFADASVLRNGTYETIPVVYVDIVYFINEVLKEKVIDYLWMDTEYAEYDILDVFYKNGRFDRNGIKFCQMSLEVHNPSNDQKIQFMEFVKRLVDEKRFGFFFSQNAGHMRMWLFNFESHYCVRKFLTRTS